MPAPETVPDSSGVVSLVLTVAPPLIATLSEVVSMRSSLVLVSVVALPAASMVVAVTA